MRQIDKLDHPVAVTFELGQWDVVQGLLVKEMDYAKKCHLHLYEANLRAMREAVIATCDEAERKMR